MLRKNFNNLKKQQGVTLIELAGVLGIFGLFMAGIAWATGSLMDDTKVSKDSETMLFIKNKMVAYSSTSPNTANINTALVIALRAVPSDKIDGAVINNNLGGTFVIAPATITNANDAITITGNHYNQKQCATLAKSVSLNFLTVVVNTTTVKNTNDNAVIEASLNTACTNQNNNKIIASFLKG
jgi:hypothetical protein